MKDNIFTYLLIGALVTVIILMRACESPPPIETPTIVTKTDTVYVDKLIKDTVYTPGPVTIITRKLPAKIDTVKVINDYYKKKVYQDTIKLDGIGSYAVVEDTI